MTTYLDTLSDLPLAAFMRLRQRVAEIQPSITGVPSCAPAADDFRFRRALEQALTEQWSAFNDEQRVRIYFPGARSVGERVELPQRGTATIERQELSPRFGLFVTYRLADGSLFRWEHFD